METGASSSTNSSAHHVGVSNVVDSKGGAVAGGGNLHAANSSSSSSWPQAAANFLPQSPIPGFMSSYDQTSLDHAFANLSLSSGLNQQHGFQVSGFKSPMINVQDRMMPQSPRYTNDCYTPPDVLAQFYSRAPLSYLQNGLRQNGQYGMELNGYGLWNGYGSFRNGVAAGVGLMNNGCGLNLNQNHQLGLPMQNSPVQVQSQSQSRPNPKLDDFTYQDRYYAMHDQVRRVIPPRQLRVAPEQMHDEKLDVKRLVEHRGQLLNLAMDSRHSTKLRDMLDKIGREEFDMLFGELIGNISQLILNHHGNHFFQKLVQVCSADQRNEIVVAMTREPYSLVTLCMNSYGAGAVQQLLHYLTSNEQKKKIVEAISPGVVALSKDHCGHPVVIHCMKNFPHKLNEIIFEIMVRHCFDIAVEKWGCCVLQTCVTYARGQARERLLREIISNAQLLSEDQFGNYIIQCLIGLMDPQINVSLLTKLQGNFARLSSDKYGSNVVECCLENFVEKRHVESIIIELLESPDITTLFSHPYGNYVVQVALSVSKGSVHDALVREIQRHAPSLQSNQYGKKTLSWFDMKKRNRSVDIRNKFAAYHH